MELAAGIMGENWVNADHFRFGASSLLVSLLAELDLAEKPSEQAPY